MRIFRWAGFLAALLILLLGMAAWAAPPMQDNDVIALKMNCEVPIYLDIGAVPVALNVVIAFDDELGSGGESVCLQDNTYLQNTWTTSALCAASYMPGDAGAKIASNCSQCAVNLYAQFTPAALSRHLQLGA